MKEPTIYAGPVPGTAIINGRICIKVYDGKSWQWMPADGRSNGG